MTDTETNERLERAEHRIRGFEELAFSFADTLNTRTGRYEAEFADVRSRLGLIDRAISMLQLDVRDMRSGVTAQLIGQDTTIRELVEQVKALNARVDAMERRQAEQSRQLAAQSEQLKSQGEQLKSQGEQLKSQGEQLTGLAAKLDVILARLSSS